MKKFFILLFFVGLIIRAYCVTRPGFLPDMGLWLVWMQSIERYGFLGMYTDHSIVYPPVYPAVLWFLTVVFRMFHISLAQLSFLSTLLLKIPSVIFDIGTTFIVFRLLRSLKKDYAVAWVASLLYWLNPAVIFDGAAWGQVDSVPSFFVIVAFASYFWRLPLISGIAIALAVATKLQMAVVVPLIGFLWLKKSPRACAIFVLSAFLSCILIHLPFVINGGGDRLYDVYMGSIGWITSLSHNAWNMWWPMSQVVHVPDTAVFFYLRGFAFTYRQTGLGLLLLSLFFIGIKLSRNVKLPGVTACCALAFYSFFMLPTQMHERYAFPAVVFFSILAAVDPRTRGYYVAFTVLFFSNLLYVFPIHSLINRGVSWTTVLYTEWCGIYVSFGFIMLYLLFFRYVIKNEQKSG